MFNISDKTKFELKKAGFLLSLFLALFFVGFFIVNIFDFKSALKKTQQLQLAEETKLKEELAKRTAQDGINTDEFQAWAKANKLKLAGLYNGDPDDDGLANNQEFLHGTNPNLADTDGDKFPDKQEIVNGYDPDAPGDAKPAVYVKISKIQVDVPMIWSQNEDEKISLKDLERGLSHFPKSAAPGENGNVIISGHSSNYVWAKGDYNYVFKRLNDVLIGDIVDIKTVQKNGKVLVYQYKITDKFITTPDDARIFAENEKPTLTLSTCWPLGTNFKRLIVKAEIVKP